MNPARNLMKKYRFRLLLWMLFLLPFVPLSKDEVLAQGNALLTGFALPKHDVASKLPELSILEAKSMLGPSAVIVQGTVTAVSESGQAIQIQDASGGLQVRLSGLEPSIQSGDAIRVHGYVADHQGIMEIRPASGGVKVLKHGKPVPPPKALTSSELLHPNRAEAIKGTRVRVTGVLGQIPDQDPASNGSVTIPLQTAQGSKLSLRIPHSWVTALSLQQGSSYEVTAVLGQFHRQYLLVPQTKDDLIRVDS